MQKNILTKPAVQQCILGIMRIATIRSVVKRESAKTLALIRLN